MPALQEYQKITGGHTNTCPCYPLTCPQACGAEVLRKDLTAHQGVFSLVCPFHDMLSEEKFFQYYDRLKQEHEALKEAYTSLKEATGLLY